MLRAATACICSTSQLPKVVREWCALYILTWKCSSRHNCVHFFDISTSKSGPRMACFILTWKCASRHNGVHSFDISNMVFFVHFDLDMCFAPNSVLFFISHLASWLRTRRFSETRRSHKSVQKHGVSRLSYLFAHLHLLSSDSFSSLIFSLLLFSLLLFSSL